MLKLETAVKCVQYLCAVFKITSENWIFGVLWENGYIVLSSNKPNRCPPKNLVLLYLTTIISNNKIQTIYGHLQFLSQDHHWLAITGEL